jgi:serine/threonine protein phosphatase PrpC
MAEVEIDLQVCALRRGDRFLLCSDGLSGLVEAAEMGETVLDMGPQAAARSLVDLACERGGDDNITVIILRIDEAI